MEDIIDQVYPTGTTVISYADDLAVVSSGKRATQRAQEAIDILYEKCTLNSITISEIKSKAIAFRLGNKSPPKEHITIENKKLEWVDHHMYLGVILDKRLSFTKHQQYVRNRTKRGLNVLRCLSGTSWAGLDNMTLYYTRAIRGLIEYAAPAIGPIHNKMGKDLEVVQNLAIKTILRVPRDTNPIAAAVDIGLDTIEQRFVKLTTSFLAKTVHRPDNNPLKQSIMTKQHIDSTWHKIHSWAANATEQYRDNMKQDITTPIEIANLTAKIQVPWEERKIKVFELPMTTSKDKCNQLKLKERSIEYIQAVKDRIHNPHIYYTDGSVNPNNLRAASAFTMTADNQQKYQRYIRISDGASTLQTELMAILIALSSKLSPPDNHIVIFTDSLAAIKVLDRANPEPQNIELVNKIIEQAEMYTRSIEIHWIPSHIGIEGNEEADGLANKGVGKERIDVELSATTKQHTKFMINNNNSDNKTRLENMMENNRHLRWLKDISDLKPWKNRPKLSAGLAKQVNMLRLNITPHTYNGTRKTITCRYCKTDDNTPTHYLATCPELTTHRHEINQEAAITETDPDRIATNILKYSEDNIYPLVNLLKKAPYLYQPNQESQEDEDSCPLNTQSTPLQWQDPP